MSDIQPLLVVVAVVYFLALIVQVITEGILVPLFNIKTRSMEETVKQYLGDFVSLDQIKAALQARGLRITALEHLDQHGFRKLLDGIQLTNDALQRIPMMVPAENTTLKDFKDNIVATYDANLAEFQSLYAARVKKLRIVISVVVVLMLNANVIQIYSHVVLNQGMSQAFQGIVAAQIAAQVASRSETRDAQSGTFERGDLANGTLGGVDMATAVEASR